MQAEQRFSTENMPPEFDELAKTWRKTSLTRAMRVVGPFIVKVRFDPLNRNEPAGAQRRVHVLHVDEAAPIDAKYVEKQLSDYQEQIKKAKDEAKGTPALPLDDDENDDLPVGDDD